LKGDSNQKLSKASRFLIGGKTSEVKIGGTKETREKPNEGPWRIRDGGNEEEEIRGGGGKKRDKEGTNRRFCHFYQLKNVENRQKDW